MSAPEAGARPLRVERHGHYAQLTIDRPQVSNAADLGLWRALAAEVPRLAEAADLRAIVITGAGSKAFMAGADLTEFPGTLSEAGRIDEYHHAVIAALDALEAVSIPVVAALNGAAMGGGLELAVACDYRLAADSARMGIPAADLGLAIFREDIERIVSLVGSARAREMLIFGRVYGAAEALAIGLVNEVVPAPQLPARCLELVGQLAAKAPLSVRSAKTVIRSIVHPRPDPQDGLAQEALRSVAEAWRSDELKRRVESYLSRRKAGRD